MLVMCKREMFKQQYTNYFDKLVNLQQLYVYYVEQSDIVGIRLETETHRNRERNGAELWLKGFTTDLT